MAIGVCTVSDVVLVKARHRFSDFGYRKLLGPTFFIPYRYPALLFSAQVLASPFGFAATDVV